MAAATLGLIPTIAVATLNTSAQAVAAPAVSATKNQFGYPLWYQDSTGTRVEPCLESSDPQCVLPTTLVVGSPLALPTNFPDEFFYTIAASPVMTTPGCLGDPNPLASTPGKFKATFAVEGAFANGDPALGDQMVFGRIRFTASGGLCPGQHYTINHPYGTFGFTADVDGALKTTGGTEDIGCVPAPPVPCDFSVALDSRVLANGFLRFAAGATPGYLGGGAGVFAPVVGGISQTLTLRDDANADQFPPVTAFEVTGRLAGPLVADTAKLDFGGQLITETSTARTITLTNVASDGDVATPVVISAASITLGGTDAADFAVTGGTCQDQNPTGLDKDLTCTIDVTFTPGGLGARSASVTVAPNGFKTNVQIPLAGAGINPGQEPAIALAPLDLDFGSVRIGNQSPFQDITVSNTGAAPLQIVSVEAINVDFPTQAAAFHIDNRCAGLFIAPGASDCAIGVAFAPLHNDGHTATLKVTGNYAGGTVVATLVANGIGGVAAVSTTIDANDGFPTWYQDEYGQRVAQCIDPKDPYCIVLSDDFYDGVNPVVFPTNFPEEFFYYVVDSDVIDTPGCGNSAPGKAFIRMADEAAFGGATGGPVVGDQIVFGRIRIVVTSGLCADTNYVFTHPYGQVTVKTDGAGGIRRNAATSDVGCFPVAPAVCDWGAAIQSPVLGGFLKQDGAPVGYLGDPNVFTTVTGAPYSTGVVPTPVNYFRIQSTTGPAFDAQTSQFAVMGKLLGPLEANPTSVDFGTQFVGGDPTDPETVVFTNRGTAPQTVSPITIVGGQATDFAIVANTCNGTTLAVDASCSVDVTFAPLGNGLRNAQLVGVTDEHPEAPVKVALTGVGGAVGAAISVRPLAVDFADLHTGLVSASESVRVSNLGGGATLKVDPPVIDSTDFIVTQNTCLDEFGLPAPVAIGGECLIRVAFTPSVAGNITGHMTLTSNALDTPVVTLTGHGFSGSQGQSNVLNVSGHQTWYQDNNGVRTEPCIQLSDPNCIVLGDPNYDTAQPQVFPTNFPEEFFYNIADSDIVTTDTGGTVLLRMALEGTFTDPNAKIGTQTQFARLRITAKGLLVNTTYTFDTPWGTVSTTTNGSGDVTLTIDQPTLTANGAGLVGGPLTTGFLRWDSTDSAPPVGYLGQPTILHTIVGSQYRLGTDIDPLNEFRVRSFDGSDRGSTDQFFVSGKLAGPIEVTPTSLTFTSQALGTASPAKTVNVTNLFSSDVTITDVALTGADASYFQLNAVNCNGNVLVTDEVCQVSVTFEPPLPGGTTGPKTASLVVNHDSIRGPRTIALSGTATPGGSPHMVVAPLNLNFGSVAFGNLSLSSPVLVSNTGTAPLVLSAFGLVSNVDFNTPATTCVIGADIIPGGSCTISVVFSPQSAGNKATTLNIAGNDATTPSVAVALSGTGIAATVTVSPTSLSFNTKGSSSSVVKLTNTGTANLNLVGNPALVIENKTATTSTFTMTHNCNNIAPGKSCNVSVTFNANAGPNNQVTTATLRIKTNASNSAAGQPVGQFVVSLTGTRK